MPAASLPVPEAKGHEFTKELGVLPTIPASDGARNVFLQQDNMAPFAPAMHIPTDNPHLPTLNTSRTRT